MKTKNFWKLLMAAFVVCLPFALTSCSSDDDEEDGPVTYNYNWTLDNITKVGGTVAEQQAALNASVEINKKVKDLLTSEGFEVDAEKQTFTVTTEANIKDYDDKVIAVAYQVKANATVKSYLDALPDNVQVVFRRGGNAIITLKLK